MLDNKAKISDIIASLQESEGINQKAELKSILVDKGITVEDTNDMASIVSKVNELVKLSDTCIPENIRKDININEIIGTLDIESLGGKKYASGSLTPINNMMQVTNLDFTPSVVVVKFSISPYVYLYVESIKNISIMGGFIIRGGNNDDYIEGSMNLLSNGFKLNSAYIANNLIYWEAFE